MKDKLKNILTSDLLHFQLLRHLFFAFWLTLVGLGVDYFFHWDEPKRLLLSQKVLLIFIIMFIGSLLSDYPVKWLFKKIKKNGLVDINYEKNFLMLSISFGIIMSAYFLTNRLEQFYFYWSEQKWFLLLQDVFFITIITMIISLPYGYLVKRFARKTKKK